MITQRLIPFLAVGGAAVLLASCSASSHDEPASPGTNSPVTTTVTAPGSASVDAAEVPASTAHTESSAPHSAGSAEEDSDTPVQAGVGGSSCATSQLDVSLANEQGAAGSRLADIVFRNTSTEPCTLNGFPGVSAVTNNDGTQLGAAAARETGRGASPVTIPPGGSARAGLNMTVVGVLDPASCQPQAADGLRVYPPGETASAFIPVPGLEGCAGDANYLSIQPVTAN